MGFSKRIVYFSFFFFSFFSFNLFPQDTSVQPLPNPLEKVIQNTPSIEGSSLEAIPTDGDEVILPIGETETTGEAGEEVKIEETEPEPKTEDQILDDTISVDISTASYDELVFWCRRIGLEYTGSKSELQERLYKLYGVSGQTGATTTDADVITIDTAEKTSYYKIEEIDEDYVRIVGNVGVFLEEQGDDGSSMHKITADYIVFNKKQKLMTAYGNVLYEKKSGDNTEFFSGDSLVFNIKSWEGVIYRGVSQKEQTTEGDGDSSSSTNTFYYSGEKLIKGKDDRIKMIKGKISSSEGDFPVYSISADKIWVLAPGEWGISGATLRVGEVPLLWIPFFLKTGDSFVFNPSVGKNDDVGSFLNMTYYFLGEKEEDSSSDSFNFMDPGSGTDSAETWVDGLFLRHGKPPTDDETEDEADEILVEDETKEEEPEKELTEKEKERQARKEDFQGQWKTTKENEETYIKLMADAYSNIGQFVGLSGKISGLTNLKNFEFHAGLGLSYYGINGATFNMGMEIQPLAKMIDPSLGLAPNNLITYYGLVPDHSYFFGYFVPFRYGLEAKMDYNNTKAYFNTKLQIELYSDSQYNEHFLKYRQESFNFEQAIGLTEEDPIYQDTNRIPKLNWYMQNSFLGLNKILPTEVSPYISNFSINRFNLDFEFISESFKDTMLNYIGSNPSSIATIDQEYFVPSQMLLPDINFSMAGTLFNSKYDIDGNRSGLNSLSKKVIEEKLKTENAKIKSPWVADQTDPLDEEEGDPKNSREAKQGTYFPNVTIAGTQISNLFSHQLDYNFKTLTFQLYGYFIHETPETPKLFHQLGVDSAESSLTKSIIDFQLSKALIRLIGAADITYKASFLDNMITLNDSLSLTSNYQYTFLSNQIMDEDDEENNTNTDGSSTEPNSPMDSDRDQQVEEELLLQAARKEDAQNSNVRLTNNFNFKINPFKFLPALSGSSISYNLANTLVYYRYDLTKQRYILDAGSWDSENISTHSLNTNFQFSLFDKQQSLSFNFLLPPKQASVSPVLDLKFGMLSNRFSFSVYKNYYNESLLETASDGDYSAGSNDLRNFDLEDKINNGLENWYVDTVSNNTSFAFNNGISFSNALQYNVQEDKLTNLDTQFSASYFDNNLTFSQNVRVIEDQDVLIPDRVSLNLKLWYFSIGFNAAKGQPQTFDWNTVNWINDTNSQQQLILQNILFSFDYRYQSPALWKNRIKLGFNLNTSVDYNFVRFTESRLNFKLGINVDIHKLLSLSFDVESKNEALYLYSQSLVDQLNIGLDPSNHIQSLDLFEDFFHSFGTTEQRKASNFNLARINFKLTHHLGEWDLVFSYSGSPSSHDFSTGQTTSSLSWKRDFSISVVWGAINMIKTEINMNEQNELTL